MTSFRLPPHLETKFCASLPLRKDEAAALGSFSGYAAIFGEPDQSGDQIAPGAFVASLARRSSAGPSVKMLWQHDPSTPIGVWDEIREDSRGLFVSGRLALETQAGREAAALLSMGALDGLSIGYRATSAESLPEGRRLVEIDLWEISLVTFPMATGARATPDAGPEDAVIAAALAEAARALADHAL